jgi:flagellar motor switch protein FliG
VLKSEDYRGITGAQKAAILMMALGEEQCTRLFAMMHEDEIKDVSSAMSQLGAVKSDVVERLCLDFVDNMGAAGNLVGSYESTERLLQKSLPRERASQIMEEIRGPAGRTMWDKLGNVHEAVLANYLKNEYPQTVAVVLSKIKPDHASRVLGQLPEAFAMEVVMRMLRMEAVQKEVLDDVERKVDLAVPQVRDGKTLSDVPAKRAINVFRDGRITLDEQPVTLPQLTARLADDQQQYRQLGVTVRGDADGPFQNVAAVLTACRQAGISEMGISVRVGTKER